MKKLFLVLLILAMVVISCSAQENSFIGTWRFTFEGGYTQYVRFTQTRIIFHVEDEDEEDIVNLRSVENWRYRIDGNKIYPLGESEFYFLIGDRNTLSIVIVDDGESYTFPGRKIGGTTPNQRNSIIGTYTSDGDSFLETIEIVDGRNVVLKYSLFDMSSTTSATYNVTGSRLTITNGKDTILFDINNNGSLRGLTIGSTGTFYKE